jgi:hypothetical protein
MQRSGIENIPQQNLIYVHGDHLLSFKIRWKWNLIHKYIKHQ